MLQGGSAKRNLRGAASPEINKFVEESDWNHKFLKDYQKLTLNYFLSDYCKTRDMLLIWFAVGRGKTLMALACAIAGLRSSMFKRVIILSPKTIQDEFYRNLRSYFHFEGNSKEYEKYVPFFTMIPYNAWNSYEQFQLIKPLENSLFIIDEAHLFMKSIIKTNLLPEEINSADKQFTGNAKKIYDRILKLKHKKVLCLTGTPSAKNPFELVPIFNLAYNKPLFTENYEEFNEKYVKHNRDRELIKKLDGLISYVPAGNNGIVASPLEIVDVEMSFLQYRKYLKDYEQEKAELGFTNKKNMYGVPFGVISSFHTKTFQDCIYVGSIEKPVINEETAPKIMRMYKDTANMKRSCVFYFHFTDIHGCGAMELKLQKEGFHKVRSGEEVFSSKAPRYVVFSGDVPDKVRNWYKYVFNDKRNMYGEYIKYMILSSSGIVGITLHNVGYLGIGSVEFNYSAIRQIMGRANRLNSHKNLPEKDRTLVNKLYIMTKNMKYYAANKKEVERISDRTTYSCDEVCPTIERIIYHDALYDDIINENFKQNVLIPASITEKIYKRF